MNLFQGDVAIFIDQNGADIPFIEGQPIFDGGLQNAVLISLFSDGPWIGNIFFNEKPSYSIGSNFEAITREPITLTNLNRIRNEVLNSLSWMQSENLVQEINVKVTNPNSNTINVNITLRPPGQDILELSLTSNSINWQVQASNPAFKIYEGIS